MLNVPELERRYKTYRLKLLIPYFAITATLMAIFISIIFFLSYEFEPETIQTAEIKHEIKQIEKNETLHVVKTQEVNLTLEKEVESKPIKIEESIKSLQMEIKEIKEEKEKVILLPSLNFIDNIKHESTISKPLHKEIEKPVVDTQKKEPIIVKEIKQEEIIPLKSEEISISTTKIDNKNSINIKRKNDDDIRDVIERFNTNHNPSLSLFIAKRYYQNGEYEQAYNYALITNGINNNIEDSWILFSKALIKMNKKDEAIETLKKYISHSKSLQAKQLLDEIQAGKFQ